MASGLDRISEALKKHRADILLTIASVATAENKWKAVGQAVKDIAVWRMIGPLGVVLGTVTGIAGAFRSVLRETGSLEAALRRISQIRGLERQFESITRNAALARQRVAELVQVAEKGFKLEQWGTAGRSMEILTRGAYAGTAALKTVGDAATATRNGLEEVAFGVGDLYAALRDGRPAGAAADELRQMGVISEQTARQVLELQASGASFQTMWGAVQADLDRTSGSMDAHAKTVEGLQAKYEKVRETLAQKFGEPFAEAERQNLEKGIKIFTALGPVVEQTSRYFAGMINPVSNVAGKVLAWVVSMSGVQQAVSTAAKSLMTLVGVLITGATAFGLWRLGDFVVSLARIAITGSTAAAATTAFGRASASAQVAVTALTQGNYRLAASEAAVAVRAAAAGASVKLLGLALQALPWVAIIAAVTSVVQIFTDWRSANAETKRVVDELGKSTQDMLSGLRAQAAAITTLEDKTRALADANKALAGAYAEYYAIASKPMTRLEAMTGAREKQIAAAQEKINQLSQERDRMGSIGGLEPTEREIDLARRRREREEREREMLFEGRMARARPAEQMALRASKIRELEARANFGERGLKGRAETERARFGMAGEISAAEAEVVNAQGFAEQVGKSSATDAEKAAAQKAVFAAQQRLNGLRARSEQLGLNSGSQSLALETRANMMDAGRQLAGARARGADAAEIDRLQQLSGGLSGSPAEIRALRERAARARELETNAAGNRDRAGEMKEQQKTQELEMAAVTRREQAEARIAELKSRGVERAQDEARIRAEYLAKEIEIERAKAKPDANVISRLETEAKNLERTQQERRRVAAVNEAGVQRRLLIGAAEQAGRSKLAMEEEDLGLFASNYEDLLGQGFSPAQARSLAQRLANDEIFRSTAEGERGAVTDSLQRVGGGGGVGRDPVLSVAERQATLQEQMVGYLRQMAEKSGAETGLPDGEDLFFGE